MNTNSNGIQPQSQSFGLGPLLAGTLLGIMVGGITVLLTAPQPGAKTRAELQQGMEKFRDRTTETVKEKVFLVKSKADQLKSEVQGRAGELQHQGKGLLIKQLDRVSQLAESGKKAIQDSADHVVV